MAPAILASWFLFATPLPDCQQCIERRTTGKVSGTALRHLQDDGGFCVSGGFERGNHRGRRSHILPLSATTPTNPLTMAGIANWCLRAYSKSYIQVSNRTEGSRIYMEHIIAGNDTGLQSEFLHGTHLCNVISNISERENVL